jgi:peptidoglycan-associated lipoprotein
MRYSIWATIAVSVFLVACKSTPMTPAKVEDKSVNVSAGDYAKDANGNGADANGIKEVNIDNANSANGADGNPLRDPNNILSKRNIYFDYNSDAIRSEFTSIVAAHAKYLQSHQDAKVILQGNTDERGTREYNLSLGQRRSVAVKQALNVLGVSDAQIETISYGEEKAMQNCASEDCFQESRRVDVVYQGE